MPCQTAEAFFVCNLLYFQWRWKVLDWHPRTITPFTSLCWFPTRFHVRFTSELHQWPKGLPRGVWVMLSASAYSVFGHLETHGVVNVIPSHTFYIVVSICPGLHWPYWVFHKNPKQLSDGDSVQSLLSLTRFETITLRAKAQYGFALVHRRQKNREW